MNNKLPPHTMDSIKKKMHAMKQTYENASDRANQAEQKTRDLEDKLKKVNKIKSILFIPSFFNMDGKYLSCKDTVLIE